MRGIAEPLGGPGRWDVSAPATWKPYSTAGRRRPTELWNDSSLPAVELVVRTIAETAVANETYFCQLDSVVGDGDFGYSLARGFEKVLEGFDGLRPFEPRGLSQENRPDDRQPGGWNIRPDLGHGVSARRKRGRRQDRALRADVVAMLRAAVEGIQARGGASLGDKTLLDALVPAIDRLEADLAAGGGRSPG